MAVKRFSSIWYSIHLLARVLGMSGIMAALVGAFMWFVLEDEYRGMMTVIVGLGVATLALFFEVRTISQLLSSRRGAFGFNVLLQIVIVLAIVGGANYFSFYHFQRYDLTRDHAFTLDDGIRKQLEQLRGETEIVVYQKPVTVAPLTIAEQDKETRKKAQFAMYQKERIDHAAQRKIIEKVKDLAERFADFGPRFRVHEFDPKSEQAEYKLAEISAISQELADAVLAAPESSVFFFSRETKNVQRLSFNDIYQIDTASSIDNSNLVLHYRGEKPFTNKIFNIEEKRPRIANAVIHPVLGFQNKMRPEFTMAGARKVLEDYGFDAKDLMVRKLVRGGRLTEEPTALTYDQSRYKQIGDMLASIDESIIEREKEIKESTENHRFWHDSTLAELNKKFVYFFRQDGAQGVMTRVQMEKLKKSPFYKFIDVDEDDRKAHLAFYKQSQDIAGDILERSRKKKEDLVREKATLKAEDLEESERMTDIEARTKRMLSDFDLLLVPRVTVLNAAAEEVVPNRVHKLDPAQVNAIKQFMREGKPVLFMLGPPNEPREGPDPGASEADALEAMLGELGFKLPKQTVLFDIEAEEFNERKFDDLFARNVREVDVPGVKLDDTLTVSRFAKMKETFDPHAIRTSLRLTSRSMAKEAGQEIRVRHPRPVYYVRTTLAPEPAASIIGQLALPGMAGPLMASSTWVHKAQHRPTDAPVFLVTREESWNEENPFIIENKAPSFSPSKDDDPRKGSLDEVRRGPFPIGVAVETPIPASWYDKDKTKPKTARIAVIGSGGAFIGPDLSPLKGKMLLDVVNWLIGRDDLLAREAEMWQYPRVEMSTTEYILWQWGAGLALPLAFVYLGTIVWMVRRMR